MLIKLYDFNASMINFKTNDTNKFIRLCRKLKEVREYCIYKMTGYREVK